MNYRNQPLVCLLFIAYILVFLTSVSFAGPLDVWHWRNPLPQGNNLNGAAYGKGTYVAVGNTGTVVTSDDGINWVLRDSGISEDLLGVAFGKVFASDKYIFVTVSQHGAILKSDDGKVWSQSVAGTPTIYLSRPNLVYGNNIFLFQGYQAVMTSADGINWTSNPFSGASYADIAYCNGLFVGVGASEFTYSAVVFVSTDGVTWTSKSPDSGSGIAAVTSAGSNIFAITSTGKIYKSPDSGTSWTTVEAGNSAYNLKDVVFANSAYVAVGQGGRIVKSTDGLTWTEVTSGTAQDLYQVIYENNTFVAVGYYGALLKSSDGSTWSAINPGFSQSLSNAAYGNGIFVVAGHANNPNEGPNTDTLVTSTDSGLTWTPEASGIFYGLSFAHGNFIAVGHAGLISTSPDGVKWATQFISSMPSLYDAAYGNGTFVIVGGDNQGAVYTSSDTLTWTRQNIAEQGNLSLVGFFGVAYGNNTFVAVGTGWNNTAWSGVIFTSHDGKTWTLKNSALYNTFNDVVYGKGTFHVVGGSGVLSSTDGENWTSVSTETGYAVAYGNSSFILAGDGGKILTSEDGVTWVSRDSKTKYSLTGAVYGGGTFLATGENNTILQSDPMAVTQYALTVNISGTGRGTVVIDPAGTNCDAGCTKTFDSNSTVILTAIPSSNSVFKEWTGECSGKNECEILMDAAKTVTANFIPKSATKYTLTVISKGGTVKADGIDCGGKGHTDCSEKYYSGENVTLTASPATGYRFIGWSNKTCPGSETCTVKMTSNKKVTAKYAPLKKYILTVEKKKTGTVTGTDAESNTLINCGVSGTDCSETNYSGTTKVVTLTATPAAGYKFTGWADATCKSSGTDSCTVNINGSKNIKPVFSKQSTAITK